LAVDSAGNDAESNLRRAVRRDRTARPSAPKELRATVEDGSVILSWTLDPATEVSHLLVYRQQTNESRPVLVDRAKALAWTTSPMPPKDG
ncbi:MAG TPA: hypothetical protein PLL18_13790, partial [Flavobacteriales bacterium]|nr:hypothetical protein [Flavobacteriales bacterium]